MPGMHHLSLLQINDGYNVHVPIIEEFLSMHTRAINTRTGWGTT
ncbi:hypothetical protein GbCGDNIH7_7140 [Granulibacter bethesdensis]|nr:hypothetical protein GbCGDNIH7_7140 [Granulibacter bethesdensis]